MFYDNKSRLSFAKMNHLFSAEEYKAKYIVIFGMNASAKVEIAYFHNYGIEIGAVVDNASNKQGLVYNGELVKNPDDVMKNLPENTIILVSARLASYSITQDILKYNAKYREYIVYLNIFELIEQRPVLIDKAELHRVGLTEIKKENLKILSWLYDFCKKNNLKCFLSYGTLLGAVRHQGFIPWDDDVDVSMPFPDYIKLHDLIKDQDEFYFDSMITMNQGSPSISTIAKLKSKRIIVEDYNFPMYYEDYLAVDIWPISGYPEDEEQSISYYRELQDLADQWKEKVVIPYGTALFDMEVYRKLVIQLVHAMGRYNYYESNYVSEVYCGYLDHIRKDMERRGLEKRNFDRTIEVSFENKIFEIPQGYDEILTIKYGNWMRIPEESEKRIHGYFDAAYLINDKYNRKINRNSFDRDKKYWNDFYNKTKDLDMPSLFAQRSVELMRPGDTIVELGCGNGRDSIFFEKNGLSVTGIDASNVAIGILLERYRNRNISFVCNDFVTYLNTCNKKFNHCYSRFSMHAINEKQEDELIENVFHVLKSKGLFFIEVRSINDDICGLGERVDRNTFEYEGHFRRFIVMDELTDKLIKIGFRLKYFAEERGFAPFKDIDPPIIRIIAEKC